MKKNAFIHCCGVSLPIVLTILFMLVIILSNWPMWERSFYSDNSPVSWLSGSLIFANALLILKLTIDRAINYFFGLWLFLAMIYLVLDEQFMYHEWWKYSCASWFSLCKYAIIREAPMVAVGVFGLVALVVLFKVAPQKIARCLFSIAVAIGVLAITIDQINHFETISDFEEGFEVLAEAFFLSGLLAMERKSSSV